eukprot:31511-Pleurochrysis_carterae.AAC.2
MAVSSIWPCTEVASLSWLTLPPSCCSCLAPQLLYLGEEEADSVKLRGGETGIADGLEFAKDSTISATSAWVIEPKRGRVVIFTGGGENYHAPLPVVKGRRTTWNTWFSCACSMDDALVDDNE